MYSPYIIYGNSDFSTANNSKATGHLIKSEKITGNKGKLEICVELWIEIEQSNPLSRQKDCFSWYHLIKVNDEKQFVIHCKITQSWKQNPQYMIPWVLIN